MKMIIIYTMKAIDDIDYDSLIRINQDGENDGLESRLDEGLL